MVFAVASAIASIQRLLGLPLSHLLLYIILVAYLGWARGDTCSWALHVGRVTLMLHCEVLEGLWAVFLPKVEIFIHATPADLMSHCSVVTAGIR
jgi:hypothetical protein